jgi:hypothetical protein
VPGGVQFRTQVGRRGQPRRLVVRLERLQDLRAAGPAL